MKHKRSSGSGSRGARSVRPPSSGHSSLSEVAQEIRLQTYLARGGVCSRRAAEQLIRAGRVQVNGQVSDVLGRKVHPQRDLVVVDGRPVQAEARVLYIFHKPRGVVSTLRDPHAKRCVQDFLSEIDERVFPVGRLDADVSGLLLLTNDGDFADQMLHPRNEVPRVYVARVHSAAKNDYDVAERLRKGVMLEGVKKRAEAKILPSSATLTELLGNCRPGELYLEISVHEGAKHFVKKLLRAAGKPVIRLSRIRFGAFTLERLKSGELRRIPFPRHVSSAAR